MTSAPSTSKTGAASGVPSRSDPASSSKAARSSWSRRLAGPRPARSRTASGSVAVPGTKARVARASRIYVEGRHDAELVEKVWGDDLRIEGVVVEYLEGVDDLSDHLRRFQPGPERRVGVLVDHLVPGSKESKIASAVAEGPLGKHVLIVGHPYVDIWAAVKPDRLGLRRGPTSPATSPGSTASASSSVGRTATRPTSRERGSTSCPRSRRTPTWNRACSAGSRS